MTLRRVAILVAALLALWPTVAHAAPALSLEVGGNSSDGLSTSLQLMLLFTLLSFAPAIMIGVTAFVRIVIVLAFMRQAVGTQQMPPNQVIVALALFLTFFVMMPTIREVNQNAIQPYLKNDAAAIDTLERGFQPLRAFMLRQTREKDLALFLGISGHDAARDAGRRAARGGDPGVHDLRAEDGLHRSASWSTSRSSCSTWWWPRSSPRWA